MPRENARERFVDLAQKRVCRAIKDIRLVGNLSNRNNYSYTDEDTKKIVRALTTEVKKVDERFNNTNSGNDVDFSL